MGWGPDALCIPKIEYDESMSRDTDIAARQAQTRVYQRMSPAQRVELASTMSESARTITEAGIRARNPELSDDQIHCRLLQILLGESLYLKAGLDECG